MSTTDSDHEEATTKEEITGEAPAPPAAQAGITKPTTSRNAFAELMKPKAKPKAPVESAKPSSRATTNASRARDGLGAYTQDPASFPASRVIYYDDDFVVINDLYPKAVVHTLLLPRSSRRRLHPFEAFNDPEFLAKVQAAALKLKRLVAKELQKRLGKYSEADKRREAVLSGEVELGEHDHDDELPAGRDWEREVKVGIHAHPSMNDLHVHVISRDMYSECMRHRKHYNSFNTPFLIDVADFPLAEDDPRRHARYLEQDLLCWRCGQNFKNKFKQFEEHLAHEFDEWKKE